MTKEERVAYRKVYYQNNKERELNIAKIYRANHPNIRVEGDKRYRKTTRGRFLSYKSGAKMRGLVFGLDLQFFKDNWCKDCYYCGDKINGIGIDRKDNDIGYTTKNAVLCCEMCNKMKLAYTFENFINHCQKISNNLSKYACKN